MSTKEEALSGDSWRPGMPINVSFFDGDTWLFDARITSEYRPSQRMYQLPPEWHVPRMTGGLKLDDDAIPESFLPVDSYLIAGPNLVTEDAVLMACGCPVSSYCLYKSAVASSVGAS